MPMTQKEMRAVLQRPEAVERALVLIDDQGGWLTDNNAAFGSSLAGWVRRNGDREPGERLTEPQVNAARNMLARREYLAMLIAAAERKAAAAVSGTDLPSPIPGERLRYDLLPAGATRLVHVLVPQLQARLKGGPALPVIAVRSPEDGYTQPRLYRWVEILGPSRMEERFANPLPGTNGRGVIPLVTESALRVWSAIDQPRLALPAPEPTANDAA